MATRVSWVAVSSSALGGVVASCVAIVTVDQLIAMQADQRLRAATLTLSGELAENLHEAHAKLGRPALKHRAHQEAEIRETVDDENGEIVASGIRLAVFDGTRLVAGPDASFPVSPGACETRFIERERIRACSTPYRGWQLVAAQPIDAQGLYLRYLLGALGAIVLGAGMGALSGRALSRWAVRPLEALSSALRVSRPEAPMVLDFGRPGEYEEVEAIRSALQDLSLRRQELLEQAQRFAGDAAHELRTPLTALRTELELLAEESRDGDRVRLERACRRVERLGELVERLLVLALPTDKLQHGFEAVALADLIEEVAHEASSELRARLVLDIGTEGLVRGDPRLLTVLLRNALENAMKFAEHGAVELSLRESRTSGHGRIELTVTDQGPGIPRELRARVFDAFFRVKPGKMTGHGLGLALIGHIARAHGGSAAFEDVPTGARLSVVLPAWTPRGSPHLAAAGHSSPVVRELPSIRPHQRRDDGNREDQGDHEEREQNRDLD